MKLTPAVALAVALCAFGNCAHAADCEKLRERTNGLVERYNGTRVRALEDPAWNFNGPSWMRELQEVKGDLDIMRQAYHQCVVQELQ